MRIFTFLSDAGTDNGIFYFAPGYAAPETGR
jgi:hypothetical protein